MSKIIENYVTSFMGDPLMKNVFESFVIFLYVILTQLFAAKKFQSQIRLRFRKKSKTSKSSFSIILLPLMLIRPPAKIVSSS